MQLKPMPSRRLLLAHVAAALVILQVAPPAAGAAKKTPTPPPTATAPPPTATPAPVSDAQAAEIAIEAYHYAFPLVLMDVSRQVMTNAGEGAPAGAMAAPVNQIYHMRSYPDASFTEVVRPNADTLYSTVFFDVAAEPLVIDVPDSGGRYYLLPMLDYWTDVFASPGKRTSGTIPQTFAITGPGWSGELPAGVKEIKAPTAQGWLIGRTQTNGPSDYPAVHKFQDGLKAVPLSQWGKPYTPPAWKFDPSIDRSPPVDQVKKMSAGEFFARFAALTNANPPHANDYPILARMARIGLVPGEPFDIAKASPQARAALEAAPPLAFNQMLDGMALLGMPINGWRGVLSPIGTYGTDYKRRAIIAYSGLGANTVEDAYYPSAFADSEGRPLESGFQYRMHFDKEQLPPVNAFWSLTVYDERQLFAANPINRYAIGDRDPLRFNPDGSLDLYIQRESPGADNESNWLPTPANGKFTLTMRLYWPKLQVRAGRWAPPIVERLP